MQQVVTYPDGTTKTVVSTVTVTLKGNGEFFESGNVVECIAKYYICKRNLSFRTLNFLTLYGMGITL